MHQNNQLSRWVVGVAFMVCIAAALGIGAGKSRFRTTASVSAPVEAMDCEAELAALLTQPNHRRMDIARMNLLAGSGLSQGEELTLTKLDREHNIAVPTPA